MKTDIPLNQDGPVRNQQTREGYDYWDKICKLQTYAFLFSPDGKRIVKTPGMGSHIDVFEAQQVVSEAQDEINQLRFDLAKALAQLAAK